MASLSDLILNRGMRALDCGCGPGAISEGLAEALGSNGQVVGIDFGESQIQIANTRATPNLTFRVASVYELPFEDNSFEAVATPEVVKTMQEHLSPESYAGMSRGTSITSHNS